MLLQNFRTGKRDKVDDITTIEAAKDYVPQIPEFLEQLDNYAKSGHTVYEAIKFTIEDYYTAVYDELGTWYNEHKGELNDDSIEQ